MIKYYMQIDINNKAQFRKFFEAANERAAEEIMSKEVGRIYAESEDISKHNTNLYQLIWINGV